MPYALIPEGFTLKKVTKAQEKAVSDWRRHNDVVAFLSNETTPLLVGATGLVAIAPLLANLFISVAEDVLPDLTFTDEHKEKIRQTYLLGIPGVGVSMFAGDLAKDTFDKFFGDKE
jgi:hypothetical protein